MRIFIYDTTGKNLKMIIPQEQIGSLQYSNSLFSDGSASFSLLTKQPDYSKVGVNDVINQSLSFREQVFFEENNEIVWGGVLVSMRSKNEMTTFMLSGHLSDLKKVTPDKTTYNGTFNEILADIFPQKEIELHEASNVLGSMTLKTNSSDTVHTVLQKILRTSLARRKMVYEKDGLKIKKKILIRGIQGVVPEGVGILYKDKNLSADLRNRWRNNTIDFSMDINALDPVTRAIVYYNDDSGVEQSVMKEIAVEYFGLYEKSYKLHFITKKQDAEEFAQNSLQVQTFSVKITTTEDDFKIGDRLPIWFFSYTNTMASFGSSRIEVAPSIFRIDDKKVSFKNGKKIITYTLGNKLFNDGSSIVEIVSNTKQDTKELQSMI